MRRIARPGGLLLLWSLACAGPGFEYADLPADPVWLVYRTLEESERVAELAKRAKEGPPVRRPGEHHFRLEDVGSVLGLGPTREDRAADMLGHLARIDPRTQVVEVADFAGRGSRPLDWDAETGRLLYLSLRRRVPQVFEYVAATGEIVQVTHGDEDHLDACYGPGGSIAVVRFTAVRGDGAGGLRIFVREPGGGRPRPVTRGPADFAPSWRPDGRHIAYQTVDASGRDTVAVVDLQGGGEPRRLARGGSPVYTPDGEWIVYVAATREGQKLWKMRSDGSGKRALGRSPHEEMNPAVSPDGRFVAFVSLQDERRRLLVRSIDGEGQRPLILDGDGLHPAW